MVNKVEPFSYQESTNIDEHNQIVDKVNEVVDVINDADLDNIPADIADAKATASQADTKADNAIAGLATKADKTALDSLTDTVGTKADKTALDALSGTVDTANANIAKNTADIADLSTKDIKSVEVIKPSPGKVQVRLTDNGNTPNDSNIMDLVIPTEYTIISGTTDRSFKIHIKMSDGSEIDTNDMVIPEGGGTDVSITSVTLTSPATNQIKVKVGLSDSSFIESQPLPVVTAVSGTVDGGNLTISVNGVTSAGIPIPSGGHDYTAGNGVKISEAYEISIDDAVVLTKAEAGTEYLSTQYNVTAKTITTDDTNLIVTDTREIGNVVGKIALSNLIKEILIEDGSTDNNLNFSVNVNGVKGAPFIKDIVKTVTGSVEGNNLTIGVNGVNSSPIALPLPSYGFTIPLSNEINKAKVAETLNAYDKKEVIIRLIYTSVSSTYRMSIVANAIINGGINGCKRYIIKSGVVHRINTNIDAGYIFPSVIYFNTDDATLNIMEGLDEKCLPIGTTKSYDNDNVSATMYILS